MYRSYKKSWNFEPDKDFATYSELVGTMSVLLKSAYADDEKSMDFIDWQSYEMKFVFDPSYDEKWSLLLPQKI